MNRPNCNQFSPQFSQMNMDPCNMPYNTPLFPLYGYDSCEDIDNDMEYLRYMYPAESKKILQLVEDECDQLEYDGSCMFDQYPDKVKLSFIVSRIYARFIQTEGSSEGEMEAQNIPVITPYPPGCCLGYPCKFPYDGCCPGCNRTPNWLSNLIEIMLYHEIGNRRRRYRSRKRWF